LSSPEKQGVSEESCGSEQGRRIVAVKETGHGQEEEEPGMALFRHASVIGDEREKEEEHG
jgi:hypothetical protein